MSLAGNFLCILSNTGHHFQGACTRAGLDLGSGEIVTVCEWVFKSKQDKRRASFSNGMDSDAIVKQVKSHDSVPHFI